jgi:hypothetical protein
MKKIINGKVYDTDRARLIADVPHPNIKSSEGVCIQRLYLKRNGEYFLWLAGARSEIVSNMVLDSQPHDRERHFYPITYEQAKSWCESELLADEYISIFGEPEGANDVQLNLTISASTAAKFKMLAQERSITQKELFEALVKEA